jgi:very-short-patch-repair endonuclease
MGDIRPQPAERERKIAALAGGQHGVVTHQQLVLLGVTPPAIQHRLRCRRLHAVHRGVYSVGHALLSGHGRWMAAVFACGDGAVLSHHDAGDLWGIPSSRQRLIHITAPTRRQRPGLMIHEGRGEAVVHEGIPVTTVARTLLDLAEVVPHRLDRALEASERLCLFDLRELEALMRRSRGRRGLRALDAALRAYREEPITRSELERMFLELIRKAGLPLPVFNTWIGSHEVDVVWHEQRRVVELDGHEFHRTRATFERDRIRDAELQLAGYRVLRITRRRLDADPHEVVSTLRAMLVAPLPTPML